MVAFCLQLSSILRSSEHPFSTIALELEKQLRKRFRAFFELNEEADLALAAAALIPNYREKKWTHGRKKLLITTRLRHEADFSGKKKKRNTIWETILREIKDVESSFPFSRDDITRCFLNIMGTYKRIKKRNNTSGEASSNWEYFDEIDEVFGSRSSINVPLEMTDYSLEEITINPTIYSPVSLTTEEDLTPTTSRKRKRNDVIEFLEKESEKDGEVLDKLLKLAELKQLRALFEAIGEKNRE
ncbi:uncharacterized protein LOC129238335 [Anastrepha obliqua]|uniref:uncharacterized protein LOC129238335 n=1 Tax=Anastrepha obliqua TaxID=95512 RepID=UPI00240A12AC|nr:uncharacterized protein LOC129238335 [Anastrepha obliqua]